MHKGSQCVTAVALTPRTDACHMTVTERHPGDFHGCLVHSGSCLFFHSGCSRTCTLLLLKPVNSSVFLAKEAAGTYT